MSSPSIPASAPEVTLYHLQSSQSMRVLWALIYCEVPHNVVLIPRRADRHYAEIIEHSSLGKAPVLKVDDKIYMESRLCIEQVRELARSALSKKDPDEAKRDDYFSELSTASLYAELRTCLMFELVGAYSPLLVRPLMRGICNMVVGQLKGQYTDILKLMEAALTPETPFFGGKKLGVSDFMMSWPLDMAVQRNYIDLSKWPNIKVWYESIQGMESYQKALKETKVYQTLRMEQLDPSSMSTANVTQLTYRGAQIAIEAAVAVAEELGVDMNIAVVDRSCHLLAFLRMPDAKITGIQLAQDKAYTAAGHRLPTSHYIDLKASTYTALNQSNRGRFAAIGGGVPITDKAGRVIGGIGCGSGSPEQDEAAAAAGASRLLSTL